MKILRSFLLSIIILGSFGYSGYIYFRGPCADPLGYYVGTFNEKFGVSRAEFQNALAEAEAIWEKSVGRDLFVYDASGELPVNLIYDERQATAVKNKSLEAKIDTVSDTAESVSLELESVKIAYARAKARYESDVEGFKARQDAHVKNVEYWNRQGGAPADEYAKLTKESNALNSVYQSLEAGRATVNDLAEKLNGLVKTYNGLIKNINANVAVINESADKEFEQGEYISDREGVRINIYEFTEKDALVRVLAHELGHALGVDHNDDPDSIMYYLNKSQVLELSEKDKADVQTVCRFTEGV